MKKRFLETMHLCINSKKWIKVPLRGKGLKKLLNVKNTSYMHLLYKETRRIIELDVVIC